VIADQLDVGAATEVPRNSGHPPPLSINNLRRVYKAAAVETAGDELGHLDLRGPHDLRHTVATWLEDAAVPSRVIDELMGHAGGRRDRGAGGSPMGRVYRETTPAMLARVTATLDERIGRAPAVAAYLLRERQDSRAVEGGEGR
jgi:integrase